MFKNSAERKSVPHEQSMVPEQPSWDENPFAGYEKVFKETMPV